MYMIVKLSHSIVPTLNNIPLSLMIARFILQNIRDYVSVNYIDILLYIV